MWVGTIQVEQFFGEFFYRESFHCCSRGKKSDEASNKLKMVCILEERSCDSEETSTSWFTINLGEKFAVRARYFNIKTRADEKKMLRCCSLK